MKLVICCCILYSIVAVSDAIGIRPAKDYNIVDDSSNVDEPLFLTSYIERGDIQGGQKAALVPPLYGNIISYSGFLTVNHLHNSNLFFWFFPAEINNATAPLVIWLQGGPGGSSLFGLFEENGPFYIDTNYKLVKRDYYWTKTLNVIYIDNPVGTGFSFTGNLTGYARNQVDVGRNLYIAVKQFLTLFPQYLNNDLYVTGESYAGKYVPALAYAIDEYNVDSDMKINLKGIAIGDGLCDPISMLNYADYLYQIGLIDKKIQKKLQELQDTAKRLIELEQYELATDVFSEIILGDNSGFSFYYNYLHYKDDNTHGDVGAFVNSKDVRSKLHVGNLTYHSGEEVEQYLKADISRSIKPWFEVLIEKYRVVLYSGQLDIIVAYPLTLNFIHSLNWTGVEQYRNAERKLWYVDNELAGYTKTAGKFTEILVRNAGHMVPSDQPKWAYDLIQRITGNIPF
ncbi:hypothetical protein O3M35_008343 [Rhynocoris fuscipes]|uniref:Carboxypeptidase n=1 Tax=Rhynocoris fuscipes TaxID=488301 RepID=A0AAW1D775_9HEMI